MDAKYFQDDNYIYECKTAPDREFINPQYLKLSIEKLKNLWKKSKPKGYRYIFPVNNLDEEGKKAIELLKQEHPDVDIRYYEKDSVERLVVALNKTGSNLKGLVNYIQEARKK